MFKKILIHIVCIALIVFAFFSLWSKYEQRYEQLATGYQLAINERDRLNDELKSTVTKLEERDMAVRAGLTRAVELSQSITDRYKRIIILIDAITAAVSQ